MDEIHYHGLWWRLIGIKQCPACTLMKAKAAQYDLDKKRMKTAVWKAGMLVAEDGTIMAYKHPERVVGAGGQ